MEVWSDSFKCSLFWRCLLKGVSVPLFFSLLEDKKQGHSDHFDRIDLLELFLETFGKDRIKALLGEREFIGALWITYLKEQEIPYVFRLKENGQKIANSRGTMTLISRLFYSLKPGRDIGWADRQIGTTHPYHSAIAALRSTKGELVVVMHPKEIQHPMEIYVQRWQIECMFKAFKSNGFNLEETHISHPDRFMTLLGVLALAFCFAYRNGMLIVADNPRLDTPKNHGALQKSVFRIGLDHLQNIFINMFKGVKEITKTLRSILNHRKHYKKLTVKAFVM